MRKVINIPARDSVRDWREWAAEGDDIDKITVEEKRLDLQNVIYRLQVLRGLGGGALIMGLPGEDTSQPAPDKIGVGQLSYVHVVNRYQLNLGDMIEDPTQEGYGGPSYYEMQTTKGPVTIHPSRVIPFRGSAIPCLQQAGSFDDRFWGESLVAAYKNDVDNYETAKASLLRMVTKAAYMRVGISGLMEKVGAAGGEERLQTRLRLLTDVTTADAVVFDAGDGTGKGGETIDDATIQLAGIVDTINGFGAQIAAVADIPITRLMGKSSSGLNSSGDSEQKDWNKSIAAIQTLDIDPCLAKFDKYMLQSAGVEPTSYTWPSLSQPSQKEEADRFLTLMTAIEKVQAGGYVPDRAMAKGVQSLLTEESWLPGMGQALADIPEAIRFGIEQGDPNEVEPDEPEAE